MAIVCCASVAMPACNKGAPQPVGTRGPGPGPGAPAWPPAVREALAAHVAAQDWSARLDQGARAETRVRTAHIAAGKPRFVNRLALEPSPYLRQHAHNPVDWRPWGPAAFAEAAALGRPILLSVGYSTCHWCHVMEHESFEDLEIAEVMNARYVPIKVDRETLPDVDAVYMAAVTALTGRGGWPMTVWLTPERKPFFAGTYFPARTGDRGSREGFLQRLVRLADAYAADPAAMNARAARLARRAGAQLEAPRAASGTLESTTHALARAVGAWWDRLDVENGGLGQGTKFPSSLPIDMLLTAERVLAQSHPERAKQARLMRLLTARAMRDGGLWDHAGGGFHRYTTERRWRVPHFEKMLYDNALLIRAYARIGRRTDDPWARAVAADALEAMDRQLGPRPAAAPPGSSPEPPVPPLEQHVSGSAGSSAPRFATSGLYASALDADSVVDGRAEEGAFYVWTRAEAEAVLGPARAAFAAAAFDLTRAGDHGGANVLRLGEGTDALATRFGLSPSDVVAERRAVLLALRAARARRPLPFRDTKQLAGWNGLMLSAAAEVSLDVRATPAARTRALFAVRRLSRALAGVPRASLRTGPQRTGPLRGARVLPRVFTQGVPVPTGDAEGRLEDYAFVIQGQLAAVPAFLAAGDQLAAAGAVGAARGLTDRVLTAFRAAQGGYVARADDAATPLGAVFPWRDGASPSANGVMAENLARLYAWTGDAALQNAYRQSVRAQWPKVRPYPASGTSLLRARLIEDSAFDTVVVRDGPAPGSASEGVVVLDVRGPLSQALRGALPVLDRVGDAGAWVCKGARCTRQDAATTKDTR